MKFRSTLRRTLVALIAGVLIGGGLMAVTPAGAEVHQAVSKKWKKIWKKQIRPQADQRYYTKKQGDKKYAYKFDLDAYQPKGNYELAGTGYSKAETYAKSETYAKGETYSKGELDAKFALLVNSVAATAGGDQSVVLTTADQVVRSVSLMPPADGTVVVSSSAYFFASSAGNFRCSISLTGAHDSDAYQVVHGDATYAYLPVAGTRGFTVTKGSLLTVNLVCDVAGGSTNLIDSHLTAIFAPS